MPPDGTVRGSFDFDAGGAIASVRTLRSEAHQTDQTFRKLGTTADEVSGRVDRSFTKMATSVGTQSDRINKSVDSSIAKVREFGALDAKAKLGVEGVAEAKQDIKSLGDDVRDFGKIRGTAHVEISGLAAANAGLTALEVRLRRFSHMHAVATARVRTAGGGGLGGGVPAAAARAAAGGAGGSGLRGPPGGLLGLGALALLPAVQALGGTAIGVAGSAAAGATAAGTVAGAGLGTLGVGLAPTVGVVHSFAKEVGDAQKAQEAYNKVVAQYGAASKQAETAKKKLDAAMGDDRAVNRTIASIHRLQDAWAHQVVGPTRPQVGAAATTTLNRVRRQALPTLAPGMRSDVRTTTAQATRFGGFLTAPGGAPMQAALAMEAQFTRDLPIVERSLENVLTTMSNVARISLPYFHEANLWIEHQTAGWASWSKDTSRVQTTLDHGVESFKRWRDLAGSTFRIVRDLFSTGRPTGDSVITDLSKQLDKWDVWIRANPQKVQSFFHNAWGATKNIAGAVWEIAKALGQVSNLLLPVLSQFSKLAGLAGGAGLLLPLALRGGMGYMLGRRDPGVAAVLGGRGVMGMGAIRGAQAAGGGALPGALPVAGRMAGGEVVGGAMPGAAAALPFLAGRWSRSMPPIRGGQLVYGQQFRYGGPVSQLGPRGFLGRAGAGLAAAPGAIATGARSLAGFVGPVMAFSGALGAATTPGTAYERLTGGLSAATFGLIPAEGTRAQLMGKGATAAQTYYSHLTPGASIGAQQARVGALQREITRQQALLPKSVAGQLEQPLFGKGLPITSEVKGHIKALRTLMVTEQQQLRRDLDRQAVMTADSYMSKIGTAWTREARTKGPVKATKDMNKGILAEMTTLRNAGKVSLGDSSLAWEHELAKRNPKLKGEYESLKKSIVSEFDAMGQHVKIVNDTILTGSTKEWLQISSAISGPAAVAAQKAIGSFRAIQAQALGSLQAMGYNKSQAQAIVKAVEQGKLSKDVVAKGSLQIGTALAPSGAGGQFGAATGTPGAPRHATGGRLIGPGLADIIGMPGGGKAAPGELIVNRHTETDVDRDLMRAGKPTLDERVRREKRAHSAPTQLELKGGIMPGLARGGRLQFFATGGRGGGASQLQTMIDKASEIATHNYPYVWGGGHNSSFSPPYDCSGAVSAVLHAGGVLGSPLVAQSFMGFGQPGDHGPVTLYASPSHVYMALNGRAWGTAGANPGGGANWIAGRTGNIGGFTSRIVPVSGTGTFAGAATGAAGTQSLSLHGIKSGMRGVPGALADRASDIYAKGMQDKINAALGAALGGGGGAFTGKLSGSAEQQIAQFFSAAGMGRIGIAGLIGNAVQESSLNWGAAGGGMWQQISNFGSGAPAPLVQMQRMLDQIKASGVFAQMNAATSPAQAADIFERGFEKAGIPNNARREAAANAAYAAGFSRGGRIGDPSFLGWFDRGTDFTTRPGRPVMFGAGERQAERVRIERTAPSANRKGGHRGGGHSIKVEFHGTTIGNQMDLEQVGEHVARKLVEALDRGEVTDSALE